MCGQISCVLRREFNPLIKLRYYRRVSLCPFALSDLHARLKKTGQQSARANHRQSWFEMHHIEKCTQTTCLVVLPLCQHTSPAVSTRAGWGSLVSALSVLGRNEFNLCILWMWLAFMNMFVCHMMLTVVVYLSAVSEYIRATGAITYFTSVSISLGNFILSKFLYVHKSL